MSAHTEHQFMSFVAENPEAISLFASLARERRRRYSNERVGINALIERFRWEVPIETRGDEWKCNNSYAPWLSRWLAIWNPDLDGAFEVRTSEADHWALTMIGMLERGVVSTPDQYVQWWFRNHQSDAA